MLKGGDGRRRTLERKECGHVEDEENRHRGGRHDDGAGAVRDGRDGRGGEHQRVHGREHSHVYGCRMPDGQVAPTDGWSPTTSGASVHAEDKCATSGALTSLGEGVSHTVGVDTATWTFSPLVDEALDAATLWRAGDADGGPAANATYEFWLAGPTESEAFGSCVYVSGCMNAVGEPEKPFAAANLLPSASSELGRTHIYLNASCGGLPTY